MGCKRDRTGIVTRICEGGVINTISTVNTLSNLDSRRIGVTLGESMRQIKEALENRKPDGCLELDGMFLKKIYEGDDE